MSKFLEGVDEHTPEKDLDKITAAKRELQNILLKADIMADAKVFKDEIFVKLPSNKIIKLEIIDVKDVPVEDQEDISKKAKALSSLFNIKTPKVALPGTIGDEIKTTQKTALDSLRKEIGTK